MHKKGGIDVSINSIVIIIFAITMLGLGLAFIKGQFSSIQDKITYPEPDIPATANEPIVLPFETLVVNPNTEVEFASNFYNNYGELGSTFPQISACAPGTQSGVTLANTLDSVPQTVRVGESATFKALMTIPKEIPKGKYACNLEVGDENYVAASKQFFIEVK